MTYQERQTLNALSKECFGTASRWKKLMDYGIAEEYERDREVMLPGNGEFVKKVFKDKKFVVKHYSLEEVKKLMEDILEKRRNPNVKMVDTKKVQSKALDDLQEETEKLGLEFK